MAERVSKNFKIAYGDEKKRVKFSFEGDFLKKCREKFGIEDDVDIILVDDDGFEVDEETLENQTTTSVFTLKQKTKRSQAISFT